MRGAKDNKARKELLLVGGVRIHFIICSNWSGEVVIYMFFCPPFLVLLCHCIVGYFPKKNHRCTMGKLVEMLSGNKQSFNPIVHVALIPEHAVLKNKSYKSATLVQESSISLSSQLAELLLCVRSHHWQSLIHLASSLEEETLFSLTVFTSPFFPGLTQPAAQRRSQNLQFCWGITKPIQLCLEYQPSPLCPPCLASRQSCFSSKFICEKHLDLTCYWYLAPNWSI